MASKELKDHELIPKLAVDLAGEEWILVTGDDAMPAEHGHLLEQHELTVATLNPWDERKVNLEQEE